MKSAAVQVPLALLLEPGLPPSAKLIGILLRQGPVQPAELARRSGLSLPTVQKGLAMLAAAGWEPGASGAPATPAGTVSLPAGLVTDRRLGVQARLLYATLQAIPGGRFTYAALSAQTGANPRTLRRAVGELAQNGWLTVDQPNRRSPILFRLENPELDQRRSDLALVQHRLSRAPYRGEALMREWLTLLVDSVDFEDDATPGFLVNPYTDEEMQIDRFYPPSVGFEYNGPQHYGPTERFSAEQAKQQRGRDYMKLGICVSRGISLVVIHAADLSLNGMLAKIGTLLPLRNLEGYEPQVAYLESESRPYRRAARRGRFPVV